ELKGKKIYGQIFSEIAPFAYNECIGQDNMPLTKEEAKKLGFAWRDDLQITTGRETLQLEQVPDHIRDVADSITNEILACQECSRNYKITLAELQLYRMMTLPIPHTCFYCRHKERIARRGPFKLFDRKCSHCGKLMKTNFAPDRKEIVYCEQC